MDLDDFKEVNVNYGHHIRISYSQPCHNACKKFDSMVIR
nr:hypothetical protein [uncultured Paraglaciecola sp.]